MKSLAYALPGDLAEHVYDHVGDITSLLPYMVQHKELVLVVARVTPMISENLYAQCDDVVFLSERTGIGTVRLYDPRYRNL